MKARPIIFTGHSVRAIIAGRKTQSRRLIRWPLRSESDGAKRHIFTEKDIDELNELLASRQSSPLRRVVTPYGRVADRLWIKEAWAPADHMNGSEREDPIDIAYRADQSAKRCLGDEQCPIDTYAWNWERFKWKSPLFMPRWASRLTLEVVGLRIEPLQAISELDALAEGLALPGLILPGRAVDCFSRLWDEINGRKAPWSSNPTVIVVTFRKAEVDADRRVA